MSVGKFALKAVLMTSMMAMPALVHAADASKLSVSSSTVSAARAGTDMQAENQLAGSFLIPLLALAAVALGILVLLDDEDEATSP